MPKKRKTNKKELAGSRVKLSFRRHLLPPMAGLLVAVSVFGFFNSQLLSGKIAYYLYERKANVAALDQQTASSAIDKNAPSRILINKLNVEAPVILDQMTVDEAAFQKALQRGVVHYPNTALPGKAGNVVIFGHSSGQWWAPGDYKFVFTQLDKLMGEDKIFVEYQGVRYIYSIYEKSIVLPTEVSVLNQSQKNELTLITCTPVGSNAKRLIVKARQIVPKVVETSGAPSSQTPLSAAGHLPSNTPSFWHDLRELISF